MKIALYATILLIAICVIIDDQRLRELEAMHEGIEHAKPAEGVKST